MKLGSFEVLSKKELDLIDAGSLRILEETGVKVLHKRALGLLDSLNAVRTVVRNSFPTKRFLPSDADKWEAEYAELRHVK